MARKTVELVLRIRAEVDPGYGVHEVADAARFHLGVSELDSIEADISAVDIVDVCEVAEDRAAHVERDAVIARTFEAHSPANTRGMVGHARPHFWGCTCGTFDHGEDGHRKHLIAVLAALPQTGDAAAVGLAVALCDADTTWEHHDQTDDHPCSRCRRYAQHALADLAGLYITAGAGQ